MLQKNGMPGMYEVMRPILKVCSDGHDHKLGTLTNEIADWFNLTAEQRLRLTRNNNEKQIYNRTRFAVRHLKRAELLCKSPVGLRTTKTGRKWIEGNNASCITSDDLMTIPSYKNWKQCGIAPSADCA